MAETEGQKEAKICDDIKTKASVEAVYRPSGHYNIRQHIFNMVAEQKGIELFDSLISFVEATIESERGTISNQVVDDLGRIEYYVNNAGWDTEERHGREISLLWGLRAKYAKIVQED